MSVTPCLPDDPGQGHLFDLHDTLSEFAAAAPPEPDTAATAGRPKSARPRGRNSLDHLPHNRIEHDLPEAEKIRPCCGGGKHRIGEDFSRELEFTPAKSEVNVLPKYACPKCRDGVAGPGLVAYVLVSKFADHHPLYRLEDILTRHGAHLSRSTSCDWVRNAADLLGPRAELQKTRVSQSPVVWTDDTPVIVLGGENPGSATGRFWAYIGDAVHPYSVYDFTMSRARDVPAAFLAGYQSPGKTPEGDGRASRTTRGITRRARGLVGPCSYRDRARRSSERGQRRSTR